LKRTTLKNTLLPTALACCLAALSSCNRTDIAAFAALSRTPVIDPDYSGTVVPPNIAPMDFIIKDDAAAYAVRIAGPLGDTIFLGGKSPRVIIPPAKWRRLLRQNRGHEFSIIVYARNVNGEWQRFAPITNAVASDTIDGWLVYRKILGYQTIPEMSIRQRSLGDFGDKVVLDNRTMSTSKLQCINCHSFCNYQPDNMIIHMRGADQGMILVRGDTVTKIDTRTKFNKSPASYASWHPSGKYISFAVMKVTQTLHSVDDPRVVFDESSGLILYNVETNTVSTCPRIADPLRMETLPDWSPDGKYLYFCSAARPPRVDATFYDSLKYKNIRYDLMRIPFDVATGVFGALDTVLTAWATGLSNVQPKVSPDGRFLLFVTTPYSYFAGYNDKSRLCLMDLRTKAWRPLDTAGGAFSGSFHSWSSNGRWFVFNSRRRDGVCGCPYFAAVDTAGNVGKPFILPQRDPEFYATYLKSFNVPVLIAKPIRVSWREICRVTNDPALEKIAKLDPGVDLDALSKSPGDGKAP
jgi:hypothetical protein